MSRILAFVDDSHLGSAVRQAATALADLFDIDVEEVTVTDPAGAPSPEPEAALLSHLEAGDVAMGVLGIRDLAAKPELVGHVAAQLLTDSPVPLVLVPPADGELPAGEQRWLLPLDGSADTDGALLPVAGRLRDAGAGIEVLHVYSSQTVPRFIESSGDLEVLASEFLLRHVPGVGDDCQLRLGDPGQEILDRARSGDIDGVIVAWQQDFSPGRAEVVRRLLRELRLPLLVVPMTDGRSGDGASDG